MKALNLQGIAIPFFTEAQWQNARTVMDDGHTFHDSYADFVQRVADKERELRGKGHATVRINIEPKVFASWCAQHGRKVDAESRGIYAALVAAENERSR